MLKHLVTAQLRSVHFGTASHLQPLQSCSTCFGDECFALLSRRSPGSLRLVRLCTYPALRGSIAEAVLYGPLRASLVEALGGPIAEVQCSRHSALLLGIPQKVERLGAPVKRRFQESRRRSDGVNQVKFLVKGVESTAV